MWSKPPLAGLLRASGVSAWKPFVGGKLVNRLGSRTRGRMALWSALGGGVKSLVRTRCPRPDCPLRDTGRRPRTSAALFYFRRRPGQGSRRKCQNDAQVNRGSLVLPHRTEPCPRSNVGSLANPTRWISLCLGEHQLGCLIVREVVVT